VFKSVLTQVIVDDMIDTGSRIVKCAELLRASGARRVFAFCTHGLFSGDAVQLIQESPLTEVVVTNTIPIREYAPKIRHLSVSGLLAECIRRIYKHESVSEVYKMPMI
jgi:ribose-phosphate pyrophosphokinase